MNKTILITRSRHDETTNYLFHWAEKVIKEANNKKYQVIDLKDKKSNNYDFCGRIKKLEIDLIFMNGHGNSNMIAGYNDETLISIKNKPIFNDEIIYALSCSSAKCLGIDLINNGIKCFIGYKKDFIFIHEDGCLTKPINDKTAELFLDPSNLIITTLIKNNTTQESFFRSQDEFKRNIRKLMVSESSQVDRTPIPYLYWDMTSQVCLGDKDVKI